MDELKTELRWLKEKLGEMSGDLKRVPYIEKDLAEHMRRTDLLENMFQQHNDRFRPLERHVSMFSGAFKALTTLGILAALLKAGWELAKLF